MTAWAIRSATAAVLFLTMPAAAAHAAAGEDIVREWFDAWRAAGASAQFESISTEGDRTIVRGTQIGLRFTPEQGASLSISFRIPEQSFDGLRRSPKGYAIDAVAIPEITIEAAGNRPKDHKPYSLSYIMRDIALRDLVFPSLPRIEEDPARPASRYAPYLAMIKEIAVGEQRIGSLAVSAPGQSVRYRDVRAHGIAQGRLAETSIASVEIDIDVPGEAGEDSVRGTLRYGNMRGRGYDFGAVIDLILGTLEGGRPLLEEASVENISGDIGSGRLGIERIEMRGIGLHATVQEPLLPVIDRAMTGHPPGEEDILTLLLDVYRAFSLDRAAVTGISAAGGNGARFELDEAAIERVSSDGLGRISVSGLRLSAPDVEANLGRFEIADIGFPRREAVIGAKTAIEANDLRGILDLFPTLGRIEIAGLSAGPSGKGPVRLGFFRLAADAFIAPIPTEFSLVLQDLVIPVEDVDDPEVRDVFQIAGIDALTFSQDLRLKWHADSETLAIEQAAARVKDIGSYAMKARVSGVPRSLFERPETAQDALGTMTFDSLSATLENDGLVAIIRRKGAEEAGVSERAFVSMTAELARSEIADAVGDAFADQAAAALRTFLDDGRQIVLEAAPAAPVPLVQIIGALAAAPATLPSLLNVSLSAR